MDFIDRWKYKIIGRKVPVLKVLDVGENGHIKSFVLSTWIRRQNSLLETWNVEGAEISPNHEGYVTYTDDSGLTQPAYVEYKGRTANIYVRPRNAPALEKVIGAGAMWDDIADAMDVGRSMRNVLIGMFIGMAIWALFIGPILGAMAK